MCQAFFNSLYSSPEPNKLSVIIPNLLNRKLELIKLKLYS